MSEKYAVVKKDQIERHLKKGDSTGANVSWVFGGETTAKSSAALWCHDPGTKLPARGWKWHDDEQIEYIVSGKLLIQFPDENENVGEEYILEPGDFVYIAAFHKHRGMVVGEENAVGIMFAPSPYDLPSGQPQLYDHIDHD